MDRSTRSETTIGRRTLLRAIGAGALGVAAAPLLDACAPAATPSGAPATAAGKPAAPTGKIVVGVGQAVPSLDPTLTRSGLASWTAQANIYDSLYTVNEKGQIVPSLATAHQVTTDQLTHTFTIRQGVKWHDGTPLTAEDVAFTFNRAFDPKKTVTFRSEWPRNVVSATAQGDKVVVLLKAPDPIAENRLASPATGIVPKDYVTKVGDAAFDKAPIGSGPFKFVSHVQGNALTLEAHEAYWGGMPKLKALVLRTIPEAASQIASLQAGEVNMLDGVDPTQIDLLQKAGLKIVYNLSGEAYYFKLNGQHPALKDVRVRRAVQTAINRQQIIDVLYKGLAEIQPSYVIKGLSADDPTLTPQKYDPAAARALLQQASFDSRLSIDIDVPVGRLIKGEDAAASIVNDLKAVGITAALKPLDAALHNRMTMEKKHQGLFMETSTNRIDDPSSGMSSSFICVGTNSEWCDPAFDKQLVEADKLAGAARTTAMRALNRKLYDDAAGIWLWSLKKAYPMAQPVKWTPTLNIAQLRFHTASEGG